MHFSALAGGTYKSLWLPSYPLALPQSHIPGGYAVFPGSCPMAYGFDSLDFLPQSRALAAPGTAIITNHQSPWDSLQWC